VGGGGAGVLVGGGGGGGVLVGGGGVSVGGTGSGVGVSVAVGTGTGVSVGGISGVKVFVGAITSITVGVDNGSNVRMMRGVLVGVGVTWGLAGPQANIGMSIKRNAPHNFLFHIITTPTSLKLDRRHYSISRGGSSKARVARALSHFLGGWHFRLTLAWNCRPNSLILARK
jgi:hypothetical protein